MAVGILHLRGVWPDRGPDDYTVKYAAQSMGIEIIGKKQLCDMDHRVFARVFMVRVQYDESESAQAPDQFQWMLQDFENCAFIAEPMYDTMRSKPQF